MRSCKSIYILTFFLLLGFAASSQLVHFSQAYSAHLTLNPANTGRFDGDWRAVGMYRQQGYQLASDYSNAYFSFEHPIYWNTEKIDAGFFYYRDMSAGSAMPIDRLNFSLGKGVRLDLRSYIFGGVQLAYVHRQVNWGRLTFPEQYNRDTGGFDNSLPTSETFENSSSSYLDAGFGLLYHRELNMGVVNFGYSIQQLNRPNESFFDEISQLPVKHVFHSKGDLNLNEDYFVIPAFVFVQTGNNQLMLTGINVGYNLNEWINSYNNILAGVHLRNANMADSRSIIFNCGVTWQFWTFMVSYDTSIASGNTARLNSSGIEFGLTYKLPSTDLTQIMIPWERY